jgi:hypothetical protein
VRARWYSQKLGQFTSHDPLGYVDTQNLYAFAAFDPINGWDPYGLSNVEQTQHPGDFNPVEGTIDEDSPACAGVPFCFGGWMANATRETERTADAAAKKRRKVVKQERRKAQKKLRECQEGGGAHCTGPKAQLLTVEVAEEVFPESGKDVAETIVAATPTGKGLKVLAEVVDAGKRTKKLLKRLHRNQSGGVGLSKRAIPPDGTEMTTDEALDAAADFLGAGYKESHPGIYISADGKRRVRMTDSDLADPNAHADGPHLNFEIGETIQKKSGKVTFVPKENNHIYIDDP